MKVNQKRLANETKKWLLVPTIVAVLASAQAYFTTSPIFWLFSVIIAAAAIGKIVYVLYISMFVGSIGRVLDDE